MATVPSHPREPAVLAALAELSEPWIENAEVRDEAWARDAGLTVHDNLGQQQGRENRVDWLQTAQFDPKLPRHVRGWLKNEQRVVAQGKRPVPLTPRGYEMAHGRLTPAREGFDYSNAQLQNKGLNKLEEQTRVRAAGAARGEPRR